MTIRPGQPWGAPGSLPPGAVVVDGDADAAALVTEWAAGGRPGDGITVGLRGGDLHRTIGAPPVERMTGPDSMLLPCDVGVVRLDDGEHWFVSHLVAGDGPWFARPTLIVMNAAFIGSANLGPKAHPGDGRFDVTEGRLGWRARRQARARFGAGAHLPHPALATTRPGSLSRTFEHPVTITLDGVVVGRSRHVEVELVPDVLTIAA